MRLLLGTETRRRSSTLLALQAEQWRSDDLGLALLQEEERVLSVINQQIHACVTLIYMQVASKHTQRKAIQEAMVTYLDTMSTDDGHAVVELVEMQRLLDRRASAQEQDVERAIQTRGCWLSSSAYQATTTSSALLTTRGPLTGQPGIIQLSRWILMGCDQDSV